MLADLRRPQARSSLPLSVVLVAVAACSSFEPAGDHPMQPPDQYRAWFEKTRACSGLNGDFDRIKWFVVDGDEFDCPSGKCVGRWNDDHSIFIARAYAENEMVVRHEILHDLIGHPGHPDPPFGNPCPLTWATWHGDDTSATGLSGRVAAMRWPNID
jgi:hypothetical protein